MLGNGRSLPSAAPRLFSPSVTGAEYGSWHMTGSRKFDAIIIGTGQAGPSLAARVSAAGMTVAIIERHKFGGTCVNTGCIPTKTLVASAYAAHLARRGQDYGFSFGGLCRSI